MFFFFCPVNIFFYTLKKTVVYITESTFLKLFTTKLRFNIRKTTYILSPALPPGLLWSSGGKLLLVVNGQYLLSNSEDNAVDNGTRHVKHSGDRSVWCTTGQTEEKHQGLDCGTSQKIQQHCQGRASLLSPKPLKACAPLTHSTQSSSAGVCSDLGKEGKEKLFRAQTFFKIGLLNYDKNHNHDYFGQYCNHDYLKLLLVGHMTKTLYESFI